MPTATTSSFLNINKLVRVVVMVSAIQKHDLGQKTNKEDQRHRAQNQAHAKVLFALLGRCHH
jgi:hypothetical protein